MLAVGRIAAWHRLSVGVHYCSPSHVCTYRHKTITGDVQVIYVPLLRMLNYLGAALGNATAAPCAALLPGSKPFQMHHCSRRAVELTSPDAAGALLVSAA